MATALLFNRVGVNTATTGTGTVTLGAVISNTYATFAEAGVANGNVVTYVIEDGNDFEIGRGTYTSSGTTMSRDTVLLSKIGGTSGTSKINLSGSATVRITLAKEDVDVNDFTSETAPATGDLLWLHDASAAAKRKMTLSDMLKVFNSVSTVTPDKAADFIPFYDTSGAVVGKATPNDISRAPTAGDGISVSTFTVSINTNNAGGIGAYALLNVGTNTALGSTVSGGSLAYSGGDTSDVWTNSGNPSGTWRLMGGGGGSGGIGVGGGYGLWIRTA